MLAPLKDGDGEGRIQEHAGTLSCQPEIFGGGHRVSFNTVSLTVTTRQKQKASHETN